MAVSTYAESTVAKGTLAVLGKVSAATFAFTLGIAVLAIVAGAALVAQMVDFESPDEKKQ